MRTVLQHGDEDCLLACYAMILSRHGRQVGVADLAEGGFLPPDGLRLSALRQLNERFGLDLSAWRCSSDDLSAALRQGPLIAHWDGRHFVVLLGCNRSGVSLADPASGRMRLPWNEFDRHFAGTVVRLTPNDSFERGSELPRVRRALAGLSRQGMAMFVASLAIAQACAIGLAGGVRTLLETERGLWVALCGLAGVLVVGHMGAAALRLRGMRRVSADFESSYAVRLFDSLLGQPLEFFARRGVGGTLQKLAMRNLLRDGLILRAAPSLLSCLSVVALAFFLAVLSVPLATFLVVTTAVFTVLNLVVAAGQVRSNQALTQAQVHFGSQTQHDLVNMVEAKARGRQAHLLGRWTGLSRDILHTYNQVLRVSTLSSLVQQFYLVVTTLGVVALGLMLSARGDLEPATILVFQAAATGFVAAAIDVQSLVLNVAAVGVYWESHQDLLHERPATAPVTIDPGQSPAISVRDLSVVLPGGVPVLDSVSFDAPKGAVVAIVGPSGAGKSTLLMALLGLRDFTGTISFADPDFRARTGLLVPEMTVGQGTLRGYLTEGLDDVGDEDLVEVLLAVGLHERAANVRAGLDAALTAGGLNWSAGQRQRLLLARSMLAGRGHLFWDEPFSNLDDATRRRLYETTLAPGGPTRLVISHHTDVLERADLVCFVPGDGSCLVGTATELAQRSRRFSAMVSMDGANTARREAGDSDRLVQTLPSS